MSRILVIVERFYPEDFLVNDLVAEWTRQGDVVEVLTQVPSYPFDKIFDGYENKRLQTTIEHLPIFTGPIPQSTNPSIDQSNNRTIEQSLTGPTPQSNNRTIEQSNNQTIPIPVHRVNTIFGYNASVKRKVLNYLDFGWRTFWWAVWHGRKYERVFVYHTAALTMASAVYALKTLWRKPISIWTQDLWPDAVWGFGFRRTPFRERLLNAFVRSIYARCDRIMVSCRGFVPRIRELCNRDAEFVPQWESSSPDLSNFSNLSRSQSIVFMFAGNLGKPQNLENDIEGFLKAEIPDAEFWLVGGGVMLDPLKEKYGASARVKFCGRQPKTDMPMWFAQADALVISLTEEYKLTLPGKFQSYIKTGKPLMGILLGDAREMIDEHALGVTADPDDIDGIARAFRRMAEIVQRGEGARCGKNAQRLSDEMFNRERLIARLRDGEE